MKIPNLLFNPSSLWRSIMVRLYPSPQRSDRQTLEREYALWILLLYTGWFVTLNDFLMAAFTGAFCFWIWAMAHLKGTHLARLRYLFLALATIVTLLSIIPPANAQFLNNLESFLKTFLSTGGAAGADVIVTWIVGIIRVAFMLYFAIGMIQAHQNSRNGDEDFMTLAKNPLKMLATVVIVDIVIGILGGTGTTGA